MKYFLFCILFLVSFNSIYGQQFGGHPPSQKWKQINTDTARIIFPILLDSQARRVASIIHSLARQKPLNPGYRQHKIDIVLQHQTTVANGYAGLGPFRSEFYLTPSASSFELGSIPWADQLAVHEYRHVQQFNHFRNGLTQLMFYLFGEEGLAVGMHAAVPGWFYEGDAVYSETLLSEQGRGRLPLFINAYKSLWLADKNYSWMKLRNGSLKDYIPSHYHLGYLLVAYGREKYGNDFWENVTRDASAYKGLFYPFQQAVKRHTGVRYKKFIRNALDTYKKDITGSRVLTTIGNKMETNIGAVSPLNNKVVTHYQFPYIIGKDSLVYLKTGYRQRPAFFIRTGNHEKLLRYRDIGQDENFGYRNGKIVYTAYNPDIRWGWKDYSEIRLLDVISGEQKNITRQTKYFWPDISEDGSRIVAIHLPADGENALHILDTKSSGLLYSFKHPGVILFTDPKFLSDDEIVAGARYKDGSMNLVRINFVKNTLENLTPITFSVVGNPSIKNQNVYFTASYSGNDDLYSVDLDSRKVFKITSEALGKYHVNATDSLLYFSGFTTEGYQLQKLPVRPGGWKEFDFTASIPGKTMLSINVHDPLNHFLNEVNDQHFEVQPYSRSARLLNFHSWRPYYEDPLFSFSIFGENVLNTLQTELYYQYNQNDKDHSVGFNTVYGGLFPYLSAGMQFTFNRLIQEGNNMRQFHQLDSRIGFNIPLNVTSGRSYKFFNAGSNFVLRNEFNTGFSKGMEANDFSYFSHFINWNQQVPQVRQHIFPRLGYALTAQYRHAITNISGYQAFTNGFVYLPGFLRVHHLVLSGGFQQRDTLRQLFSNRLAYSRGYIETYFSRMWRTSANYHFPIVYPDKGIASILYFQRVRGNVFFDITKVYSRDKTLNVNNRSAGVELFFDTKWWNEYPLTFGLRYSRLLDEDLAMPGRNPNQWEIILPLSIIPK
ncbi:MAG: hypothetical protein H0V30_04895 [Chitinophagaceae bacterium]|jgi:hypothetical protein|nr:hypothetical protein [Chitinophagaceae bacterium]